MSVIVYYVIRRIQNVGDRVEDINDDGGGL